MGGPATASGLGPSPIPVLRPQKPLHMPGGDSHRGKSLKLLEKIPEDAEATVVLVGEEGQALGAGAPGGGRLHRLCLSAVLACRLPLPAPAGLPSGPLLFLTTGLAPSPFFPSPLPASPPVFCYLGLLLVHIASWRGLEKSTPSLRPFISICW